MVPPVKPGGIVFVVVVFVVFVFVVIISALRSVAAPADAP
jgi:hypothetical protein